MTSKGLHQIIFKVLDFTQCVLVEDLYQIEL